jgi:hypothetical protein
MPAVGPGPRAGDKWVTGGGMSNREVVRLSRCAALLRRVPDRIPLSLHASGKGLRVILDDPFPGQVERSGT